VGIAKGNQNQDNTPLHNAKLLFEGEGRIIKARFGAVAHLAFGTATPIDLDAAAAVADNASGRAL
jgi:hypothetical protein